jgi:RHS repeat-associated protein
MSGYGFSIPSNGYDQEDRLVGYNRNDNNLSQSWNLSLVGDWNSVTTNGTAQPRTHGPTHELLTAAGENVTHDAKGNMTLIPASLRPTSSSLPPQALSLSWDFDNRMSTADVGNDNSIDVTYKWDALGRRVYRDDNTTAEIYFQAGQQTIADYVAGSAAASPKYNYVYASYIDEPVLRDQPATSTKLYFHRNQQYSITAISNENCDIIDNFAYSPYGVPTIMNTEGIEALSNAASRYLFTGREWDSLLRLSHFRARMYESRTGLFCSHDPIKYVFGSHLYSYTEASPLTFTDPSGLTPRVCCRTEHIVHLFTHCELRNGPCPNADEPNPDNWDDYPIIRDFSCTRSMNNGVACCNATNAQIAQCSSRNNWPTAGSRPGNNCNTGFDRVLTECCLQSNWPAKIYAGYGNGDPWFDPEYECVRWDTTSGPRSAPLCIEWRRNYTQYPPAGYPAPGYPATEPRVGLIRPDVITQGNGQPDIIKPYHPNEYEQPGY